MTRTIRPMFPFVLLGFLSLPAFAGVGDKALPPEKVPALSVPKMTQPPTIDGAIDPAEWREATAVSGVGNWVDDVLVPRPTTFYLGWDDGHLYFAVRTYLRPGYKPNVPAGRSHGLAYVWDDGMELHFQPLGKNVPAGNANNSYKCFLNCLGFLGDNSRMALGQAFKNWNPKFVIQTGLTAPGTAPNGGRWWELELSSTPEDFELAGPHRAGDQWRAMFAFNHLPGWMQARIPCNGPFQDPFGFNVLTLVENTPAVQMTMDSLSNLATDGTASLKIRAHNPTAAPVTLAVEVNVADTIQRAVPLAVAAGQSGEFVLHEKLPDAVKAGNLWVQVKQDDRQLFRYTVNFQVGAHAGMMGKVTPPDPAKFAFETRFNPVRSLLLVKGDTYYLEDPAQAKALYYRVVPESGGAAVAEGRITGSAEYFLRDVVKMPPLAPGKYRVEATMELADGKRLGPMTGGFEKKDEAREFARWWGKKAGHVERVIPPYAALVRTGNAVTCLGREYELNALGLPAAIRSQSAAVSAAPARIVVVVDGKEHLVPIAAPATFIETTDWRMRFEGQAQCAGLALHAKGWLEQDGLVYVDLTYGPEGGAAVNVDALRIEYPLAEADAEGLVCIGPGGNFSSRTTMLLPKNSPRSGSRETSDPELSRVRLREERLWSTLDTGITGSGMTVGSFYPTVWIGSERRGLLWWADNDQGWIQDDDVPAHEAVRISTVSAGERAGVRGPTAVVLRNNVIGRPVELTGPRTLAFSYIATPFKPLPKGWRMTQATDDGTFWQPFRGVRHDSKTGERIIVPSGHVNWIHPESRYPEEWESLWAEQKKAADVHAQGQQWRDPYAARSGVNFSHMSFQIIGYGRKSLENHLYDYFGPEWEGSNDTWNETYTDYAMTLFEPAFSRGGVRHTYWDIAMPTLYDDLLSGLAYRLPDGRVQRGYNGWNIRRFMMRLCALQADAGLVPGGNGYHSTNSYLTIAMPWVDSVLDGERNWDLDTSPLDWVDNMPIERMRSMSSPHAWGVPICWMGNMDSKVPGRADAAKRLQAQWVWMHDSWRNPYIPQLDRMPPSVLDWGVNEAATTYYPYWRNPLVTSADKDMLVSLWQTPGEQRVTLGVFNYAKDQTKDIELKIDLAKLELKSQHAYARELWTEESVQAEAVLDAGRDILRVKSLPGHQLILVGIAAPEAAEIERATKALPAWVQGGLPAAVTEFGLVSKETKHFGPGQAPGVTCADAAIQVSMWQLPDRVLLAVQNTDDKAAKDAVLKLDLGGLGLEQKLIWQEFIDVRQFFAEEKAPGPSLDYYGRTLTLKALPAKSGRLVAVRKY